MRTWLRLLGAQDSSPPVISRLGGAVSRVTPRASDTAHNQFSRLLVELDVNRSVQRGHLSRHKVNVVAFRSQSFAGVTPDLSCMYRHLLPIPPAYPVYSMYLIYPGCRASPYSGA
jgi:hypothetical protein